MAWAIKERSYSQRRACALVGLHPRTYRYASRRSDDAEIRRRLRSLPTSDDGSATGACTSCCGAKVSS